MRALERVHQVVSSDGLEGWVYRVATTTCLDWLRRRSTERRRMLVVDPVDLWETACQSELGPEGALLRREDVRLGVMSTLQRLSARQRAVLVLRDVLDRSVEETSATLDITTTNVKVLLHRARKALEDEHGVSDQDVPVDAELVERFARAIEAADLDALVALFHEDVWGIVDDGTGRRRPSRGARAASRQWRNALRRHGSPERTRILRLNGEPAVAIVLGGMLFALVFLETRGRRIVSVRVLRDARRLQHVVLEPPG